MSIPYLTPSGTDREELRIIAVCPICQTKYHPLASRVVAQRGEHHLLHLECRRCGSAVVAFVTASETGNDSIGMLTDLTSEELLGVVGQSPVTSDDALDLHQWNNHHTIQLTLRREKA